MARIGKVFRRETKPAHQPARRAEGLTGIVAGREAIAGEQSAVADGAVENMRRLLASFPGNPDNAVHLAGILAARNRILVDLGLLDEALPTLDEEVEVRRGLLATHPGVDLGSLAEALLLRSRILASVGRSEQARVDAAEAREVFQQAIVAARRREVALLEKAFQRPAAEER